MNNQIKKEENNKSQRKRKVIFAVLIVVFIIIFLLCLSKCRNSKNDSSDFQNGHQYYIEKRNKTHNKKNEENQIFDIDEKNGLDNETAGEKNQKNKFPLGGWG